MSIISHIFDFFRTGDDKLRNDIQLVSLFEELYIFMNPYIDKQIQKQTYKKILRTDDENSNILNEKLTLNINNYIKKKQFYYIQETISEVINEILNQEMIKNNFYEKYILQNMPNETTINFYGFNASINSEDFNSSYSLEVDKNCTFYINKIFHQIVKQESIDKEIQIFQNYLNSDDLNAPNFVIHSNYYQETNIHIPFFPYQTLHLFLSQKNNHLTNVDKIVIMKEIAIGLYQLHKNRFFHQNLNSSYIFISRKKDAYIGGGFAYDIEFEQLQTKTSTSCYYKDPELFTNQKSDLSDESEIIKSKIKHDVYSYGVLLYEIATMKYPIDLLIGKSKEQIIHIIKDNYFQFLFSQLKNVDFDEFIGIKGIRKIIEKCMRIDLLEPQNYDFLSIINEIENLEIYKENKEEIEYRIKNADSTNEYKCTFADIVISYFQGNESSLQIIQAFLRHFQNQTKYDLQNLSYDELLINILDFFGFKNDSDIKIDDNIFYEQKFNSIISKTARKSIDYGNILDENNQNSLIEFSIKKNESFNIIPITSLAAFLKVFDITKYSLIFVYFIAKELSLIHSKHMFHGELSFDSIGVYFNSKTLTFLPLIVPFYIHFASKKRKKKKYKCIDLIKEQTNDIKNFLKIVKEIDKGLYTKLKDLLYFSSIDEYLYEIYNIILRNLNENMKTVFLNIMNDNYSSFHINIRMLFNIFINFDKNEQIYKIFYSFFVEDSNYFMFESALHKIIDYSNKMILHFKTNYECDKNENEHDITKLLLMINNNNKILSQIFDKRINQIDEYPIYIFKKQTIKTEYKRSIKLINYSAYEIDFRENKDKNQSENYVNRTLEITEIELRSIRFLIQRYINMLNPKINYRLTLKITNRFSCVRQNQNFKLSDIEKIIKLLNYKYEICHGSIVIYIKKSGIL